PRERGASKAKLKAGAATTIGPPLPHALDHRHWGSTAYMSVPVRRECWGSQRARGCWCDRCFLERKPEPRAELPRHIFQCAQGIGASPPRFPEPVPRLAYSCPPRWLLSCDFLPKSAPAPCPKSEARGAKVVYSRI